MGSGGGGSRTQVGWRFRIQVGRSRGTAEEAARPVLAFLWFSGSIAFFSFGPHVFNGGTYVRMTGVDRSIGVQVEREGARAMVWLLFFLRPQAMGGAERMDESLITLGTM